MVNIDWAKQENPEVFSILDKEGEAVFINDAKIYLIMQEHCYDTDPKSPWKMLRPKVNKVSNEKWIKSRRDYAVLMSVAPHWKSTEWIFENVLFVDPIGYVKPKTQERAIMVNQNRSRFRPISKDSRDLAINMTRPETFRGQQHTGDDKAFFMFGLWKVRRYFILGLRKYNFAICIAKLYSNFLFKILNQSIRVKCSPSYSPMTTPNPKKAPKTFGKTKSTTYQLF